MRIKARHIKPLNPSLHSLISLDSFFSLFVVSFYSKTSLCFGGGEPVKI